MIAPTEVSVHVLVKLDCLKQSSSQQLSITHRK
jgi:hypothetical protein